MDLVAIMGVDSNPVYARHIELVRAAWRRIGYRSHIVSVEPGKVPGVDEEMDFGPALQTQRASYLCRWFAAMSQPPGVLAALSDVDMLPLWRAPFAKAAEGYDAGSVMSIGGDAYNVDNFFPSCYIMATSDVWRRVVDPRGIGRFELVAKWVDAGLITGAHFTDEALLKMLLDAWGGAIAVFPRFQWNCTTAARGRLDRGGCASVSNPRDLSGLFDAHLPRGDEDISALRRMVLGD